MLLRLLFFIGVTVIVVLQACYTSSSFYLTMSSLAVFYTCIVVVLALSGVVWSLHKCLYRPFLQHQSWEEAWKKKLEEARRQVVQVLVAVLGACLLGVML